MSKLFYFLIYILLYSSISYSSDENINSLKCKWDNKDQILCLNINSNLPNSSKHSLMSVDKIIITRKQIDESGAIDLVEVLKLVPDINITQSGPIGQQASMFMRGTGSNHTLVMINGVSINDQSTTQGLHDFGVDFIQTVQQIEVYPGSSATHFGTNAIGGAINIILTGDFKDRVALTGDKNKSYEFLVNKNFIYDNSSLNIKFGSVKNESISVKGNINDEKDEVKNYTTNINYEKYINQETRFFNTTYLRQTIAEYDNSVTKQSGYESDNKMATVQFGFDKLNKNQKLNYLLFYNIYDREYDERGTIDTYKSEVLGLKYDLSKTLSDKLSFGLGSEYRYDWGYFDNNGSYSASTKGNIDNLAIYSNIGFNLFDNTNLSFFVRNDEHKQTGNNSSYKINLSQRIESLKLGVSRMSGLRNPTIYELYGTDNYGYSGNRNLIAEKSLTEEIYGKYSINDNFYFSTTLFRSSIDDNIEYVNNRYVNDSDDISLNQSGVNTQISYETINYKLNLHSSFLSSKKENYSDQLRRPEKSYGINFLKNFKNELFGNYNLNLNYNHYGKHFDTHASNWSTIEMDSTDIVDLKISKKINNSYYYLKITNLFNENYQRPHGYNQEQRNFRIGINF